MLREINGHKFTLVDRFPAKQFHALLNRLMLDADAFVKLGLDEQIKPYLGAILAWPFSGDPQDPRAWEELDIIEELPLAFRVVNELAGERMKRLEGQAKN